MTRQPELDADLLVELLKAHPDMILLIGEDRRIHFINRPEAGHASEEIVGSEATHAVASDDQEHAAAAVEQVFQTGESLSRLTPIVGVDGRIQWFQGTLVPMRREGRVRFVAIFSKDVTDRIEAARNLTMIEKLVPLCAWCKRILSEDGDWLTLEEYVGGERHARVTHGMCPECEGRVAAGSG